MAAVLAAAAPVSAQAERAAPLASQPPPAASALATHEAGVLAAPAVAGPLGLEQLAESGARAWALPGGAPAFVLPTSVTGARVAAARTAGAPTADASYDDGDASAARARTLVPDRASLLLLGVGALGLWTLVARRVRAYLWYLR
jgi:hypothetical protein